MLGWTLVFSGAVLALPQLVVDRPWQAGFLAGLLLGLVGSILVTDGRQA